MKYRTRWLGLLTALLVLVSGCDVEKRETLRVGTSLWPGYEPLFLAKEKGYFHRGAVSLVEYPTPAGAVRAMVNGSIQAATLTMDEVLKIVELGVPIKVVLVMDTSAGGDVILGRPGMTQMAQLKGRLVASEGSVLAQYVLARALELNGMHRGDVKLLNVDATSHSEVFSNAEVAAVVTYEPAKTLLLRQGAQPLFSSSDIPGEIVDVLVVREEYLRRAPDVVRNLIDGWYAALNHMQLHPRDAATAISERLRITSDEVLASYAGIQLLAKAQVKEMLRDTNSVLRVSSEKLVHSMHEQGLLQTTPDITFLFAPEYIE